ncbi:MAG: hypothetical protein VX113_09240 [Pseudomonadota bacterium]|nr:hypothetical protein [Pseudomonadota bacterium]
MPSTRAALPPAPAAAALAGALREGALPELKVLALANNRFGAVGMSALCDAFVERSVAPRLRGLQLGGTPLGDGGVNHDVGAGDGEVEDDQEERGGPGLERGEEGEAGRGEDAAGAREGHVGRAVEAAGTNAMSLGMP